MEDITNINAIPLFGLLVIIKHLTLLQLTCACTYAGEVKKKNFLIKKTLEFKFSSQFQQSTTRKPTNHYREREREVVNLSTYDSQEHTNNDIFQ